eukprot:TRINITY_DN6983_c0_g1_i2.p1 TRINITY_DN6983_c0_g1~~TRINITY_DN6983_c0_g1_i2.p1  ORF type:complete len:177 (+),score=28.13 TRINITY_DN6983_c0_g1_i2:763-1293(+)
MHRAWAQVNGVTVIALNASARALPMEESSGEVNEATQGGVIILATIGLSPLVQYLTSSLSAEKKSGIRSALTLMGMNTIAYFAAWTTVYAIMLIPACLLAALVLAGGVFPTAAILPGFILYYLYGLNLILFVFVGVVIFGRPSLASLFGSLSMLILSLLSFIVVLVDLSTAAKVCV